MLRQDTPTHKLGTIFKWSARDRKFYPLQVPTSPYSLEQLEYASTAYSLDQVRETTWFQPVGDEYDYIPVFPAEKELPEYLHISPETRLVDDVDICRALNDLFEDQTFQHNLYEFYREEYNRFYSELLTE